MREAEEEEEQPSKRIKLTQPLDIKQSLSTLEPEPEPEKEEGVLVEAEAEVEEEPTDDILSSHQSTRSLKPAIYEELQNIIRFVVVTNDGEPDSSILLTGLKNLFQRQLPNMPREHIARLVYSRDHASLAIVKRGLDVVGGITYRAFESRGFAEIVFCAIRASEQVKGYGSHLMNHLKDHVKQSTTCMHFLTYADNYAIGYFKKQGFSKDVSLDKSVWMGYIKDYEGATVMHCAMLPRIKYLEASLILEKQKQAIMSKIKLISQSHVVHKGLEVFKQQPLLQPVNPVDVPGLKEIGWNPELDQLTRKPQRLACHNIIHHLLTSLQSHPSAWPFTKPINKDEVTDYYSVIKQPMDLETIELKLENNRYLSLQQFLDDCKLIFSNCRTYNPDGSNYVKNANRLEKFLKDRVKQYDEIEY
ncbi:histone acetyltransferase [Puccinia graminis f. sp. tritici CRL 75-36-700-3]|uniref:histone acetyltransferase n=1 Tax=Puccinia graminis f. sp. tritici (strain CRL 75-36-700-3 / race SCCL) TaxID=418459 RepID=E3K6V7_PUCGT|nr:histone acetyltransferase [Puccinia graminis f. sp. tritici CRL 75-36-700-3]EFP80056.1 histone acetyltransferase [Puccinia graminis f. sp. tritici CRL 75-36-700-3]